MTEEPWYIRAEREAAAKVAELLTHPLPESSPDMWESSFFDPWDIFPLYGSYSEEFDKLAIQVLEELRNRKKERNDLAAEIFRELLCKMHLCDYGTSPRYCFASTEFGKLLPDLIEKWRAYAVLRWDVGIEEVLK